MQQTLDNLKQQDPTLQLQLASNDEHAALDGDLSNDVSTVPMENRGLTELGRLVDGLTRAVMAARERVTPLSQTLIPLRLKVSDLKDERDSAMQVNFLNTCFSLKYSIFELLSILYIFILIEILNI